jgi:hypothetical protein
MPLDYAESTRVPVQRSIAEIERLLSLYGAERVALDLGQDMMGVAFRLGGRLMRIAVPRPDPKSAAVVFTPKRMLVRDRATAKRMHEKAMMARWRALLLMVRARLVGTMEAIEDDSWRDGEPIETSRQKLAAMTREVESVQRQVLAVASQGRRH